MIAYIRYEKNQESGEFEQVNIKLTANEFAKWLVADKGEVAHYWSESHEAEYKLMTEKEVEAVNEAITKHIKRIYQYLGCPKIYNKIFKEGA